MKKLKDSINPVIHQWTPPVLPEHIPSGDMPGDKVEIGAEHIKKAQTLFPELLQMISEKYLECEDAKIVVSVCGGSGVGKSETASLLSYYFNQLNIGCYTLSGDNYPRRIPQYNDGERLHLFRSGGLKNMIQDGVYTEDRFAIIQELQKAGNDADVNLYGKYPWLSSYIEGGLAQLKAYLGTEKEIEFSDLNDIILQFKNKENKIWLKRMGRTEVDLWYEEVDFSQIGILVIEWTHGNSDYLLGVDIPILLNSTPEETLAHRKARNRDGKIDSPFTTRVLELEQSLLAKQAKKAKLILSKKGQLMKYEELLEMTNQK